MSKKQLRQLPSVSEVLLDLNNSIALQDRYIREIIKSELRGYRRMAKAGKLEIKRVAITAAILEELDSLNQSSIKNIINGTGVVLHTGFGRAPISKKVISTIAKKLEGYINLEFDLSTGNRDDRQNHIAIMLNAICGAESSLMVNNNAAAVLLVLNSLAEGKDVIVSRGQEVEIGGSFRIPDIISKSHCHLVEVGTTNRTHLKDYEQAVTKNKGVILWAHTSNYVVQGFTKEVPLSDLALLAKKKHIPLVVDLGSGALLNMNEQNLPVEKQVSDVVKTGADVITFSGDKLLGGPQSGFIIGSNRYLKVIQKNPLYRTYRCGKWTIALMEQTMRTYRSDVNFSTDNLTLKLLTTSQRTLLNRGAKILRDLPQNITKQLGIALVESLVEAGSGSLPVKSIPSAALRFTPQQMTVSTLAKSFREGAIPVVGYTKGNAFYIDLKAVLPNQSLQLIEAIIEV